MEMLVIHCSYPQVFAHVERFRKQLINQPAMVIAWGGTHKLSVGYLVIAWTGKAPAEFAQDLDNNPAIEDYAAYMVNSQ